MFVNLRMINTKRSLSGFAIKHLIYYPTPVSINYAWSFGSLVVLNVNNTTVQRIKRKIVQNRYHVSLEGNIFCFKQENIKFTKSNIKQKQYIPQLVNHTNFSKTRIFKRYVSGGIFGYSKHISAELVNYYKHLYGSSGTNIEHCCATAMKNVNNTTQTIAVPKPTTLFSYSVKNELLTKITPDCLKSIGHPWGITQDIKVTTNGETVINPVVEVWTGTTTSGYTNSTGFHSTEKVSQKLLFNGKPGTQYVTKETCTFGRNDFKHVSIKEHLDANGTVVLPKYRNYSDLHISQEPVQDLLKQRRWTNVCSNHSRDILDDQVNGFITNNLEVIESVGDDIVAQQQKTFELLKEATKHLFDYIIS